MTPLAALSAGPYPACMPPGSEGSGKEALQDKKRECSCLRPDGSQQVLGQEEAEVPLAS